jgi:hypothetical protein
MKLARLAVGLAGVCSAAIGIGSVLLSIFSLFDGVLLTALMFGVVAALLLGTAYGLGQLWKGLAPEPAA